MLSLQIPKPEYYDCSKFHFLLPSSVKTGVPKKPHTAHNWIVGHDVCASQNPCSSTLTQLIFGE